MKQEKLNRISELTQLANRRKLTLEEQEERAALRQEYIEEMRSSMRAHLDSIVVERPDGTRSPLKQDGTGGKISKKLQ